MLSDSQLHGFPIFGGFTQLRSLVGRNLLGTREDIKILGSPNRLGVHLLAPNAMLDP